MNPKVENILPDYLDGSKKHKHIIGLDALSYFLNTDLIEKNPEDVNDMLVESIRGMTQDKGHQLLYNAYQGYKVKGKNYVFSKYLSEILQGTASDVVSDFLPKDFSGYIHLPDLVDHDHEKILGLFVQFTKEQGKDFMIVSYIGEHFHEGIGRIALSGYSFTELKPGQTVKESLEEHPYVEHFGGENGDITMGKARYEHYLATTVNAVLYITGIDEETLEEYNEFATKNSKLKKQKQLYTEKPFLHLDHEKLVREYSVSSTFVKGHFRWQKWGEKYSKIKLIYIKPTVRQYKETHDGHITEG